MCQVSSNSADTKEGLDLPAPSHTQPWVFQSLCRPQSILCLMTAPNNLQHLLQVFSKRAKALETEKGGLKSTSLTGSGAFQVWDKWQLHWNLHKSCSLMRIHQAELLTNTQLQAFKEKGGKRLSNKRGISLCLVRDKRESLSTRFLKLLE